MAENRLTHKVLTTAHLLLEAVKEMETEGGGSSTSEPSLETCAHTQQPAPSTPRPSTSRLHGRPQHSTSRLGVQQPSTSRLGVQPSTRWEQPSTSGWEQTSRSSELSKLFSWQEGKGKRPLKERYFGVSKKKKLKTWIHTYVCLSRRKQETIPDAAERTALKLAGLGEKKFAVYAYSTAGELAREFYEEFPKLQDAGGFELLRASDVGGKHLVLIDIPLDGYSVEYLQAVVKSAKIFIRPLQKDLDESPLEDKVCRFLSGC